ncbi:unnamed protein product [marine sediment metagenome]|uniref:Uncharacterized protein n=1 Tax=marine sediment metagenome TaxID=412755 RepID=X1Q9P1_9ZZZZ
MVKNTATRIVFTILDSDGDPVTGAAADTPDSEYSLDGGPFTDTADEIHEIATASGIYYLDLTADETNGDVVCIQIKTATAGTKTTVLVFYTAAQSLDETDAVVDSILADTAAIDGHITADYGAAQKGVLDDLIDGGRLDLLIDAIITYVDLIDDATNGLAAIKAEVEGLAGAAMRGTDNALLAVGYTAPDNAGIATLLTRITAAVALASSLVTHDTEIKALLATIAGYIDTEVGSILAIVNNLPDGGALTALLASIASILTDTDATIPGLLAIIQADLDNPDQYKANVAALALEATLTAIKGAGWTEETLKLIKELVDELETGEKPKPRANFRI